MTGTDASVDPKLAAAALRIVPSRCSDAIALLTAGRSFDPFGRTTP
jgi:hypothetical protein